jgi:hypothetical protein
VCASAPWSTNHVDVFFIVAKVGRNGSAIEPAESSDHLQTRALTQSRDLRGKELTMTESHDAFCANGTSALVHWLVVEANVERSPISVVHVVVRVDESLSGRWVTKDGSAPAPVGVAGDPARVGRQDVESEPSTGLQTATHATEKTQDVHVGDKVLQTVERTKGQCKASSALPLKGRRQPTQIPLK